MTWYDFNEKIANVIYRLFKKGIIKVSLGRCGKHFACSRGCSFSGIKKLKSAIMFL
jgi:hypothetical protein